MHVPDMLTDGVHTLLRYTGESGFCDFCYIGAAFDELFGTALVHNFGNFSGDGLNPSWGLSFGEFAEWALIFSSEFFCRLFVLDGQRLFYFD